MVDYSRMGDQGKSEIHPVRQSVVRALSLVEDAVYVGLGIVLAVTAIALLSATLKTVGYSLWNRSLTGQITNVLDQILLVLLIVELLYTVQVSFREHGLLVEPFLVVALIAVIRRILVITAELTKLPESGQAVFQRAMLELGLLSLMILILVSSLILLQRQKKAVSGR
jgi:uncharacterized membrane protein (DUF373 family)